MASPWQPSRPPPRFISCHTRGCTTPRSMPSQQPSLQSSRRSSSPVSDTTRSPAISGPLPALPPAPSCSWLQERRSYSADLHRLGLTTVQTCQARYADRMKSMIGDFASPVHSQRRSPVLAPNAVVATSQPLAASAGLEMIRRGGNAVDAAVAAAICLTVVEPCSNGIGSDLVAQVWDEGRVYGLNGTGRSPAAAPPGGVDRNVGWHSVDVPGAPRGWADLHGRFGVLPFEELFVPAVGYAQDGFPLSPLVWQGFSEAATRYRRVLADHYEGWASVFAPDGVPAPGATWRSSRHAETLQAIAENNTESFYDGDLADTIARSARAAGVMLSRDDLARHRSEWVEPLSVHFRGHEVWEMPPNTQGIAVLIALRLLEELEVDDDPSGED
ncbi:MAG: hypothetical protein GEU79_09990, partial [Acidimicrobiia bacterium]|nr:hypothetical protein [Acidimicrobiia bacterium]